MEILSFRVSGKMGHFRKYYANNTAFTYSIPPRTTLMGIVAAVMGLPKDSYYEDFASEKINFGIRVLSPLKKSFHRLNLLSVKSIGDITRNLSSDLRGEDGRIQTPFEVISGWDIVKDDVVYQVFISATDIGSESFEKIKNHFLNKEPVYNVSLGAANFMASISKVKLYKADDVQEVNNESFVQIHSAIPVSIVKDLKFDREEYENYSFVEEDMLPGDFIANHNRELRKMNKLLFSTTPNPLRVKLKSSFYQIKKEAEDLNIQFMDI